MTTNVEDKNQAPQPGTDEYNAMMADRYHKGHGQAAEDTVEAPQIPAMPEGGHDKFYDKATGSYNWEAHAKEMMFNQTRKSGKDEQKDASVEQAPANTAADESAGKEMGLAPEAQDVIAKAGLNTADLRDAIVKNGDLTPEQYDALVKAGVPKELVQEHVSNAKYRMDNETAKAVEYAGGVEATNELLGWAQKNLSEPEKAAYNKMLAGPEWQVALDALKTRMASSKPTAGEPSLVIGDVPSSGTATGYRSRSEMKRDMADPRYRSDPTFRSQVMSKMQYATWDLDTGV